MDIQVTREGPLVVAHISGEVEATDKQSLRESLDSLALGPGETTVVDLSQLRTITSVGLSALIQLVTRSRLAGGSVLLASPSPFVREVFEVTRLDRVFELCASMEEARQRAMGKS